MDIMTLAAKITLDAGSFEKGLRNAESGMNKLGKTLSAKTVALGTFAGNMLTKVTTASFKAISNVVKTATDAYANYEQLVGGVQTLFGTREIKNARDYAKQIGLISEKVDKAGKTITKVNKEMAKTLFGDAKGANKMSADEAANRAYAMAEQAQKDVMENAGKAYQTAGVSMNHYMETATAFAASMNQATGGDVVKSAALTDKAIRDMADNANKMGTDMASVENAYRGFAKGNYTMLDNLKLGYGGTKTEMQRLLKDASAITGEKYTIGNLADMVNAIHAIQEKNGITGTTEKEARGTIQGSKNMLSAAWENVLTALAAPEDLDLSGALASLTDSAKTYLNNLFPVVSKVMDGLGDFMEQVLPDVVEKLPEMIVDFVPKQLKAGKKMVEGFGKGLKKAFAKMKWPTWDDVKNNVSKAWGTVRDGFDGLGKLIFGENADGTTKWPTWDTIKDTISEVWEGVKTGFQELGKLFFGENADGTTKWPTWEEIKDTVSEIWEGVIAGFQDLGKLFFGENADGTTNWPTAEEIFEKAQEIWNSVLEKAKSLVPIVFGENSTISNALTNALTFIQEFGNWVTDHWEDVVKGLAAIGAAFAAWKVATIAASLSPLKITLLAISGVVALIATNWDLVKSKISEFAGWISGVTTEFGEWINTNFIEPIKNIISWAQEAINKLDELLKRAGLKGENKSIGDSEIEGLTADYYEDKRYNNGDYNQTFIPHLKEDLQGAGADSDHITQAVNAVMAHKDSPEWIKEFVTKLSDSSTSAEELNKAIEEAAETGTTKGQEMTDAFGETAESLTSAADAASALKGNIDALKNKTVTITTRFITIGGGGGGGIVKPGQQTQTKNPPKPGDWIPETSAKGNWNVPYDNFVSRLHRGEMILTKSQARNYREGGGSGIDIEGLASSIVAAVREGMAGASVNSYLDGRKVTQRVNRRNTNIEKSRRFVTA